MKNKSIRKIGKSISSTNISTNYRIGSLCLKKRLPKLSIGSPAASMPKKSKEIRLQKRIRSKKMKVNLEVAAFACRLLKLKV